MSRQPLDSTQAPAGLSARTRGLWSGLVADLAVIASATNEATTAPAEADLLLLADVLRALDRLEQVRAQLDEDGLTVEGSQGQVRPHPLLNVEGALRGEVAAGLERLQLVSRSRPFATAIGPDGRAERSFDVSRRLRAA